MITLERVKPTEPAILEMVRNHYSHRDNVEKRPRTEKTSKTWWSNARLVVFSDPERTLVFAWQWPKPGMRADGQEGFNNTLFHRSERCAYLASEVVLAAEKAVIEHWGNNRAYTYVDPGKIKSTNPGFCYKMAGWKQVGISKTGKPLLEKILTNGDGDSNHQRSDQLNFKLVLKTYSQLRQLSDDETALLNTLRAMSDSERELLVESLGPPAKAKALKAKAKHFKKCGTCGISKRAAHHRDVNHPDYHEFDAGGQAGTEKKSKRASSLASVISGTAGHNISTEQPQRPALCAYEIDGKVCHGEEDDGIHDKSLGYVNYHPFVSSSSARNAADQSSTSGQEVNSETGLEDVSVVVGG